MVMIFLNNILLRIANYLIQCFLIFLEIAIYEQPYSILSIEYSNTFSVFLFILKGSTQLSFIPSVESYLH